MKKEHHNSALPVDDIGQAVVTTGAAHQVPAHAIARAVLGMVTDRARQALRDKLSRARQARN